MKEKKKSLKKFSLDEFKTQAKVISSTEVLETITGGIEDNCHIKPNHKPGNGGGAGDEGVL